MPREWTTEQRTHQAELCRQHRPWRFSTGPQTERGKQDSSRNARKPASVAMYLFLNDTGQYHAARLIWRRLFRPRRAGT